MAIPVAHSFRHAFLWGILINAGFLLLFVFRSQVRPQPMEQAFAGFDGSVPECTLVGFAPSVEVQTAHFSWAITLLGQRLQRLQFGMGRDPNVEGLLLGSYSR